MYKTCSRRIGVELEYNTFDRLSRSNSENNLPNGIYIFGDIIKNTLGKVVDINKWHQTNNNTNWIVKPDSSCGLEVCSPPEQPHHALLEIKKVIEGLLTNKSITADNRCSLHVHVEVADFDDNDLSFLVTKWIHFEPFFYFLTKKNRWINRYCKPLGFFYAFNDDNKINMKKCMDILSENKYFAINFYHYKKEKRKTIEFRIMGNDACLDVDDTINWCKLILCFVERCKLEQHQNSTLEDLSYKNLDEVFEFLRMYSFFDDQSVMMWILSKMNDILHQDTKDSYIWNDIVHYSRPHIRCLMDKIQGKF